MLNHKLPFLLKPIEVAFWTNNPNAPEECILHLSNIYYVPGLCQELSDGIQGGLGHSPCLRGAQSRLSFVQILPLCATWPTPRGGEPPSLLCSPPYASIIHQQIVISCLQHTRLCGSSYCPIVVDCLHPPLPLPQTVSSLTMGAMLVSVPRAVPAT